MRITALIKHRLTQTIISPSGPTTFEVDELIELPAQDQKVWRYMACDKFADLVRSRKLYCRRLDKLPDALEGLLSAGNFRQMSPLAQARHDGYGIEENRDQEIIESERMRRIFFVNCWHINDSESRTMWRLYAPRAESVVVVSRVWKLCACARLYSRAGFGRTVVSKVRYVDFDFPRPDWVDWGPALFKDLAYQMEREIRLVVSPNCTTQRIMNSDSVKIQIGRTPLIEAVVLHPHADPGFCRTIRDLTRRHLPEVAVVASRITSRLW